MGMKMKEGGIRGRRVGKERVRYKQPLRRQQDSLAAFVMIGLHSVSPFFLLLYEGFSENCCCLLLRSE
jgi:hypothetical protein